jgi:iron(III) transport system substrate-binding protein
MLTNFRISVFFLVIVFLVSGPAFAQDAKRIEEAKKEGGKAVIYGALGSETVDVIKKAFKKKTGLDAEYWRASPAKVVDRALSEYRAGKVLYDIALGPRNSMELMKDQGLFVRYQSPSFKAFAPDVMDPFFGPPYAYNVIGIIYNTNLVKPADAPKSLEDLLSPKYKGKFVMPDPRQDMVTIQFLADLHKIMGKQQADKFIRDLAATKPLMVESLLPAAERATTGETPIALSWVKYVYIFHQRSGAPLDYVRLPKMLGGGHFLALSSKSPYPNSGKAFTDFFMSPDGVKLLAEEGESVSLKGYYPPLADADKWNIILMDELSQEGLRKQRDEYKRIFFGS